MKKLTQLQFKTIFLYSKGLTFKEILSKSDYPKNTVIKLKIFCNVDNRYYTLKIKID